MPVSGNKQITGNGCLSEALAVYVHWPFCLSKCPYCDFNSHVRDDVDTVRFTSAFLREIDHFADRLPDRKITSIFIGGGTPSLMPTETVASIIDHIAVRWPLDDDVEITLEANPTSVEAARFEGYRSAGVNRVSLGVQALHDDALKALGRQHSVAEALAALDIARRTFPRFSFDLIYARPGQRLEDWRDELTSALELADGHISLYQLTLEEGTPLTARHARGEFELPDDDDAAALYEATRELCEDAGLPAYETSNHARPGNESRHNLTYWQGGEYVGVGPGAHGRIAEGGKNVSATQQFKKPERWLTAVEAQGHGTEQTTEVAIAERADELIMMGLRLRAGINKATFREICGLNMSDVVDADAVSHMVGLGLIEDGDETLKVIGRGPMVLNAILGQLLA